MNILMEILGMLGMGHILLAFFMVQSKKWKPDGIVFNTVSLAGSSLLVAYAVHTQSLPFLILNTVYAAVSMRGLWWNYRKHSRKTS